MGAVFEEVELSWDYLMTLGSDGGPGLALLSKGAVRVSAHPVCN